MSDSGLETAREELSSLEEQLEKVSLGEGNSELIDLINKTEEVRKRVFELLGEKPDEIIHEECLAFSEIGIYPKGNYSSQDIRGLILTYGNILKLDFSETEIRELLGNREEDDSIPLDRLLHHRLVEIINMIRDDIDRFGHLANPES